MTKMLLLTSLSLLLLGRADSVVGAKQPRCYEFSIFDTSERQSFPLPYETKLGEEIFSNSLEAVAIKWVRVDGKAIEPSPLAQDIGPHPLIILRASSHLYLYSIQSAAIATLRNITNRDDELYRFTIPKKFDALEIGYRIRLPSGKVSAEFCSRGSVVSAEIGPNGYPRFYAGFAR